MKEIPLFAVDFFKYAMFSENQDEQYLLLSEGNFSPFNPRLFKSEQKPPRRGKIQRTFGLKTPFPIYDSI